ncbi:hypothetical protein NQ317_003713 [Molorchus minor]|uniref:Uncharacterized protein n=1 Tax=Molorchus minor TaxID=1323400 RepID=A0ABQ9K393_9CUCU|nr:hypothetical protein NQ317_003713 [Molorchus minor]
MGGVVSSGRNNNDLVDNLLEVDYIKTPLVERVFRAVDRAEYFLPESRSDAYKDLAWKSGNLHLSAPCIYSEVMEGLCCYGINHGIEYHADVVQYANKKLEDFKKFSGAIDEFDFCEPKFIHGNCLCLTSDYHAQYDRVYCGAACPDQFESYIKNLIKVGGILVMPLNEQLLQIERVSETKWQYRSLLPVSFASLIQPLEGKEEWIQMIGVEPMTLQALCRAVIRSILRNNIEKDHPPIKRDPSVNKVPKKKRALRRLVVPLFESDDSSDGDRHYTLGGVRNRDAGRATFREENDGFLDFVLGSFRERRNFLSAASQDNTSEDNKMETDTTESTTDDSEKKTNKMETQAVIEHNSSTSLDSSEAENEQTEKTTTSESGDSHNRIARLIETEHGDSKNHNENKRFNEIHNVFVDVVSVLRQERGGQDSLNENNRLNDDAQGEAQDEKEQQGPSVSNPMEHDSSSKKKKREKFDSGLGDEIVENHSDSSEDKNDKLDISSSEDEEKIKGKRSKRSKKKTGPYTLKWRRMDKVVVDSSSESEGEEEEKAENSDQTMHESPYTDLMKAKIQELPLPPILKKYLNFYREF